MKFQSALFAFLFALAAPALAAPHGGPGGRGTDVLHLTARSALQGSGVEPNATGDVSLMLRQQGHADIQRFQMDVSGLAADTQYHLFALLRDAMDFAEVLAFSTDANGAASLTLMKGQLPPDLDPLTDVTALEVRDGAAQAVLDADLSAPDFLQYLVKRKLENDGVDVDAAGSLFLKSNGGSTQFRLAAINLDPNTDYSLVIDGVALETLTSDAAGRLNVSGLPGGAPPALAIEEVELHDGADQSVLSATLP